MDNLELVKSISRVSPSKIVLLVIDGLGGLPHPQTGKTELETASTPNLDRLATEGICGLIDPVAPGITPGSAPGHLALFGYDPVKYEVGRGVLEAVGIDFELKPGDVAARGNYCTVNKDGVITDRRAGRISTEKCIELSKLLDSVEVDKVRVIVRPVKEHRFVTIFRGKELVPDVTDSDPQLVGKAPETVSPLNPNSVKMAVIANRFIERAKTILDKHYPANMIVLRGFSMHPHLPTMTDIYKLRAAAIVVYPMYRGLARLVGMEVLETGSSIEQEFEILRKNYDKYDLFFIHIKAADEAGEDGDFERKVKVLEEVDKALSSLISLNSEVIVVTGDHSTPSLLKGHSWHPVPILLHSRWCRTDKVTRFSESECLKGGLGRFPATQVMPLAMAHALKLEKFGA